MENTWGKLDERFADTPDEAKEKLQDMIEGTEISDGDTWRIVDREHE